MQGQKIHFDFCGATRLDCHYWAIHLAHTRTNPNTPSFVNEGTCSVSHNSGLPFTIRVPVALGRPFIQNRTHCFAPANSSLDQLYFELLLFRSTLNCFFIYHNTHFFVKLEITIKPIYPPQQNDDSALKCLVNKPRRAEHAAEHRKQIKHDH